MDGRGGRATGRSARRAGILGHDAGRGARIESRREGMREADVGGQLIRYCLVRVPDSAWMVVMFAPYAEMTREARILTVAAAATIAVLSVLIIIALFRAVVLPLRKLGVFPNKRKK